MTLNWSLGDIVSHATQALGNRGDVALSTASFWANEAARQVWDFLPHNAHETVTVSSTTSSGQRLAFPSDFLELIQLSNISVSPSFPLTPLNVQEAESFTTDGGTPERYFEFSTWIELYPSPDSTYSMQIRYRKLLSAMTNLTDIPSMATRFRYPIFLKTKELLARHVIFDSGKAAEASAEWAAYMQALPSDRALRQRDQHWTGVALPLPGSYPRSTATDW